MTKQYCITFDHPHHRHQVEILYVDSLEKIPKAVAKYFYFSDDSMYEDLECWDFADGYSKYQTYKLNHNLAKEKFTINISEVIDVDFDEKDIAIKIGTELANLMNECEIKRKEQDKKIELEQLARLKKKYE
jgi:hypothetical protein